MRLLILLLFITSVHAKNDFKSMLKSPYKPSSQGKQGSTIGQLSEKCQTMQQFSAIFQVYQPFFSPIYGSYPPAVVMGSLQYRSVLYDICDFLIKIDKMEGYDALRMTQGFLNEMTDGAWNNELKLQDAYWNTANSLYDFKSGNFKKGALLSASTHRRLINAADESVKYYGKEIEGNPSAGGMERKADRKREIQQLARVSYQRAILSEIMKCPTPSGTPKDKRESFRKLSYDSQTRQSSAQRYIDFYERQLMKMGEDFISDISKFTAFRDGVRSLITEGIKVKERPANYKYSKNKPTGRTTNDGAPEWKEQEQRLKVNTFKISKNSELFREFRENYAKQWESYVNGQVLVSPRGLLTNRKGVIESKYRSYALECSEAKLESKINSKLVRKSGPYYTELRKKQAECKKSLRYRQDFKNIMADYIIGLSRELYNKYKAITEVWNYEALELGVNRVVTGKGAKSSNEDISSSCSQDFSPGDMKRIDSQQDSLRVELKENWNKSTSKLTMMKEMEAESAMDASNEQDKALKSQAKKNKELSTSQDVTMPTTVPTGLLFVNPD